jgi:ABC-2 type transport system ATP-binding protein
MIRAEHVTKRFGDIVAVDDVSFDVAEGEMFAFLGPNGAGKSTTIKMLTTLLAPTSGEIVLNGHDVRHDPDAARCSFGIVFQDPSLDDELTAYENLDFHARLYGLSKEKRKERIAEMLAFVDLADRKDDFVKEFSGGMKRRLEIARGLLHHPKVIFLDEPTLGLDPQTRNHMWEYLRNMNEKERTTVFFTTHYLDEAEKNAGRIAIIDKGRIVAKGTVESLKEETGGTSHADASSRAQ